MIAKKDLITTTWHVIPVKAENVLPVIEKIVPIMCATKHRNSRVINVIVTSSEQIVIEITKSHPTKTRKPCVTFLPNVLNAAKSSNTPGIRKTKEEKNTNAVSLNVPYAKKDVDIRTQKCLIQPAEEEERPRRCKEEQNARIKRLQRQGIPMSAMDPDELNFKDPPIFVYADYEAMQSADGEHRPIMVCCETDQENHTHLFYGERFSKDFLEFLDQLAINEDKFERPVIVMFHNPKGYDGMFIPQELYNQHRLVENFKDSFCFLPFSLASFPKAFELVELKKRIFSTSV